MTTAVFDDVSKISGNPPRLAYPQPAVGPCGAANRYAEVVAVLTNPARPPKVVIGADPDNSNVPAVDDDENADDCLAPTATYIGLPAGGQLTVGSWNESVSPGEPVVFAPTARQIAAGQHWLGCAEPPGDGNTPYRYPLRGSYTAAWPAADPLAGCFTADSLNAQDCSRPHTGEVFGVYSNQPSANAPTAADVHDCTRLIVEITGMTDPTRGGQLAVRADAEGDEYCALVAVTNRTLAHSMRHLGGQPIPWSL